MANSKRSPILDALASESYDYLLTTMPDLLQAIETEVAAGKTPDQIMHIVLRAVGPDRQALAFRCQQAAYHAGRMQR